MGNVLPMYYQCEVVIFMEGVGISPAIDWGKTLRFNRPKNLGLRIFPQSKWGRGTPHYPSGRADYTRRV
jgi:hypothetical protein